MKTIGFSILNRNGLDDTISCIDSLLGSDFQDFDIYLFDNGSNNTDEFLILEKKYKDCHNIIINKSIANLGFTGGNNYNLRLIKKQEYDYICLLNNDCRVEAGFLGDLMRNINMINQDAIYGPVIRNPDGSIQSCGSMINLRFGTNPRLKHIQGGYQLVDCVSGSCFVISKKVFDQVGLLDDRFFAYREESDYCVRAKKIGYPIISINSEGIIHKEQTAHNKKKSYYTYLMFRNRILFLRKYANILQYSISRIALVGYSILLFPRVFGLKNWQYMLKGIQDGIQNKGGPMI